MRKTHTEVEHDRELLMEVSFLAEIETNPEKKATLERQAENIRQWIRMQEKQPPRLKDKKKQSQPGG